jgi:UV DNA damage endonuclease
MRLGYCCINSTLRATKPSVYSSRGINRKTFSMPLAAERSLANVRDILTILDWNERHDIRAFRIGSEPLPRSGDRQVGYSITDLPNSDQIIATLARIGQYAIDHDHHLSFHPGQYVCLGSPNDDVRQLGIYALERENEVADAIAADTGLDIPINIHVGGSYGGDFAGTAQRFIDSFNSLTPSLQRRLCVENDDKPSGWSVRRLHNFIFSQIGIPITWDIHHSSFSREIDFSLYDEFLLAQKTWSLRNMQIHYSQSKDPVNNIPAHSDYYSSPMPEWVHSLNNVHIHLEAKGKEQALLKYRKDFLTDCVINTSDEENFFCHLNPNINQTSYQS